MKTGEWVTYGRLSEFAFGKLGEMVPEGACRTGARGFHGAVGVFTTIPMAMQLSPTIKSRSVSGTTMKKITSLKKNIQTGSSLL